MRKTRKFTRSKNKNKVPRSKNKNKVPRSKNKKKGSHKSRSCGSSCKLYPVVGGSSLMALLNNALPPLTLLSLNNNMSKNNMSKNNMEKQFKKSFKKIKKMTSLSKSKKKKRK